MDTVTTRIVISLDDSYRFDPDDWADEIRDSVREDLDNGTSEPYWIKIQKSAPGGNWADVEDGALSTIDTAGHAGTYDSVSDIPCLTLQGTVNDMMLNLPDRALDPVELRTVRVKIVPAPFVVEVDADAWAREYGNGESEAEVIADVRNYFAPDAAPTLTDIYPAVKGIAWAVESDGGAYERRELAKVETTEQDPYISVQFIGARGRTRWLMLDRDTFESVSRVIISGARD